MNVSGGGASVLDRTILAKIAVLLVGLQRSASAKLARLEYEVSCWQSLGVFEYGSVISRHWS